MPNSVTLRKRKEHTVPPPSEIAQTGAFLPKERKMNPEETLIAREEGTEPEQTSSFDSVPAGELINAGYRFRMLSENDGEKEEKKVQKQERLIEQKLWDVDLFEQDFGTIERPDPEIDENDPPSSSRGSYYAGPWEKEETKEGWCLRQHEPIEQAAATLNEHIQLKMTPLEVLNRYFGMKIDSFPPYLRDFLQKGVCKKLAPLAKELSQWKAQRLAKTKDEDEKNWIIEKAQAGFNQLGRVMLKHDKVIQEFKPIIEDQGTQIDNSMTRMEAEKLGHLEEEWARKRKEKEDWLPRMWQHTSDLKEDDPRRKYRAPDGLVKNFSEEAIYMMRLREKKEEREERFTRVMKWVEEQTNQKNLQRGLNKLRRLYKKSRKDCFQKKSWQELLCTKSQFATMEAAMRKRLGGLG